MTFVTQIVLISAASAAVLAALPVAAGAQTTDPSPSASGQVEARQPAPPADDAGDAPQVAFNLGVANTYVFRGVEQTFDSPQVFGGADLTAGRIYAGAWASNIDYRDGTDAEVDLYAGLRPQVGGWTLDVGAVAYLYSGQPGGADYDYLEARTGASRTFDRLTVAATAFWSPDFGGPADQALYTEASLAWRLNDRWTLSAAAGRQQLGGSDADYSTYNVGVAFSLTRNLALDLRWHDTEAHELGDAYEGRAVASLKATF